jgi:hypothetical protein
MAAVGQKLGKTSKSWNATSDVLAPIIVVIDLWFFGHLFAPVPVGNSILLATDIESGDAPALCQRSVA